MAEPTPEQTAMEQITARLTTLETLVEVAAAADPAKIQAAIDKAVSMQENLAEEIGLIKEQLGTFSGGAEELKRIRADLTEAGNQHLSLSSIVKKLVEQTPDDGEGNQSGSTRRKRSPATATPERRGFRPPFV